MIVITILCWITLIVIGYLLDRLVFDEMALFTLIVGVCGIGLPILNGGPYYGSQDFVKDMESLSGRVIDIKSHEESDPSSCRVIKKLSSDVRKANKELIGYRRDNKGWLMDQWIDDDVELVDMIKFEEPMRCD